VLERPSARRDRRDRGPTSRIRSAGRRSGFRSRPLPTPTAHRATTPPSGRSACFKPGVTPGQAHADLSAIATALAARVSRPPTRAWVQSVIPVREFLVGNVRPTLLILLGFRRAHPGSSPAQHRQPPARAVGPPAGARCPSARRSAPDARGSCGQLLTESLVLRPSAARAASSSPAGRSWRSLPRARRLPRPRPRRSRRTGAPLLGRDHHRRRAPVRCTAARWRRARPGGGAPDSPGDGATPCGVTRDDLRRHFSSRSASVLLVSARAPTRSLARIRQVPPASRPGQLLTAEFPAAGREVRQRHRHRPVRRAGARAARAVPGVRSAALLARCRSAATGRRRRISPRARRRPPMGCRRRRR